VRCELSKLHVHAYIDGELDAAGTANFEQHLTTCPDCASTVASAGSLRSSLRQDDLYERAPLGLRNKILSSLPSPALPVKREPSAARWLALAAGLLLAALLGREIFVTTTRLAQKPLATISPRTASRCSAVASTCSTAAPWPRSSTTGASISSASLSSSLKARKLCRVLARCRATTGSPGKTTDSSTVPSPMSLRRTSSNSSNYS